MHIDDAIHNAKVDGLWVKPWHENERVECIIQFASADKNKLIFDETSFDIYSETAEKELKELWKNQWKKELNAKSYESIIKIFIKGRQ